MLIVKTTCNVIRKATLIYLENILLNKVKPYYCLLFESCLQLLFVQESTTQPYFPHIKLFWTFLIDDGD